MSKTDYFVKLFSGIVRFRKAATITEQKQRSGTILYLANIGYNQNGSPVRRSLGTDHDLAYQRLAEINKRISNGHLADAANLFDVATDHEIKAALKKLEGYGSTLSQAVDFYLVHHRPRAGHLLLSVAIDMFVVDLGNRNRSEAYIRQYKKEILPQFLKAIGDKRISIINQDDVTQFIFRTKSGLNSSSKTDWIRKLSVFFSRLAKLGYLSQELNPCRDIEAPQMGRNEPSLDDMARHVSVEDASAFLNICLEKEKWLLLAINASIMFCGVRKDEVGRLNWQSINIERKTIVLNAKDTKKRRRRVCDMLGNSFYWFEKAYEGLSGEWPKKSNSAKFQAERRLKQALREAKQKNPEKYQNNTFTYVQNWARHSFATYCYALHGFEKTKELMGQTRNVDVIHTNYKSPVSKEEAESYFQILPDEISEKFDLEAKKEAMIQSNCGKAIKENGMWLHVQDESLYGVDENCFE